jgi:hypothetical protein
VWLHAYGADLALWSAIDALLTHHLPRTRAGSKGGTGSGSAGRGRLGEDRVTVFQVEVVRVCWGVGWGVDLEAGEGRHEKLGLPRILGEETDGGAIVHLPIRINTQNMKERKMFNRGAYDAPCQHANKTRIEKSKKKFTFYIDTGFFSRNTGFFSKPYTLIRKPKTQNPKP